jgi:hypothetical protein
MRSGVRVDSSVYWCFGYHLLLPSIITLESTPPKEPILRVPNTEDFPHYEWENERHVTGRSTQNLRYIFCSLEPAERTSLREETSGILATSCLKRS